MLPVVAQSCADESRACKAMNRERRGEWIEYNVESHLNSFIEKLKKKGIVPSCETYRRRRASTTTTMIAQTRSAHNTTTTTMSPSGKRVVEDVWVVVEVGGGGAGGGGAGGSSASKQGTDGQMIDELRGRKV